MKKRRREEEEMREQLYGHSKLGLNDYALMYFIKGTSNDFLNYIASLRTQEIHIYIYIEPSTKYTKHK